MSAWDALCGRAEKVIAATLAELPTEIQAEARQVPCVFEPFCEDDPELLGQYGTFNGAFTPDEISEANGPILLFLETIADYCHEEGEDFDDEVRVTFLHELGHHFGWDEGDLEARGLA